MVNAKLLLRIHRVEGVPQIEEGKRDIAGMYYAVRGTIRGVEAETKAFGKGRESSMETDLCFELKGVDGLEDVTLEVLNDDGTPGHPAHVMARGQVGILGDFIEGRKGTKYTLPAVAEQGRPASVVVTGKWLPEKAPQCHP